MALGHNPARAAEHLELRKRRAQRTLNLCRPAIAAGLLSQPLTRLPLRVHSMALKHILICCDVNAFMKFFVRVPSGKARHRSRLAAPTNRPWHQC